MADDIYNPTIKALLEKTEEDWGDPEINRKMMIPYGIKNFDKILYGIDTFHGELILVIGQEKQRKTTFAINVVINYMTAPTPVKKPVTVIDTLESGMHPSRYRDQMISNLASRYLIEEGHLSRGWGRCPICQEEACRALRITPEFLRFNTRSKNQQDAINRAIGEMSTWPLFIFGANPYQGNARNLSEAIRGDRVSEFSWHFKWSQQDKQARKISRWRYMIEEYDAKIFIADHVQQYSFKGEPSDYDKQLRAVAAISDLVAQYNIAAIVLSQISLTSVREVRASSSGKLGALGGNKAAQEANVIFSTHYDSTKAKRMHIKIEDSRKSGAMTVMQTLDAPSGAFFGEDKKFSGSLRRTDDDE
jgi:hypothetical protein